MKAAAATAAAIAYEDMDYTYGQTSCLFTTTTAAAAVAIAIVVVVEVSSFRAVAARQRNTNLQHHTFSDGCVCVFLAPYIRSAGEVQTGCNQVLPHMQAKLNILFLLLI